MSNDSTDMITYLMTILMFALSITIYEILAKEMMDAKTFTLKMKVKVKKKKTGLAPFDWKCSILYR